MQFSEAGGYARIDVPREGEFESLGFIPQRHPRMLTFLDGPGLAAALRRNPDVSAVITRPELMERIPASIAVATCDDPRLAFAQIHNALAQSGFYWEDFDTVIDPGAKVHASAFVAERNVRIGAGCEVLPHATILERCTLGEGVWVGAGAVLGGEGFQRVRGSDPMLEMAHAGGLLVESGVRILAGAVVATGLFGTNTELKRSVRIGARAFVSHDVVVAARSLVGHGAVVNGNVRIGEGAWIGPGAVIANDLTVGDGAFLSLGAAVIRDVPAGARLSGNFAVPHRRLLRLLSERQDR